MNGSIPVAFALLAAVATASAAGLPPLVGDGVTDDTAAIQARLDSGASLVYLPPPAKAYLVSKALKIGSGQELKLDRFSIVRLAPNSNCPMLETKGYPETKHRRIAVKGGIWDCDNLKQAPNQGQIPEVKRLRPKPKGFAADYFLGCAMRFCNVEDLTVQGVTVRNPTTYGMKFCRTSYFLVEDVTFDYGTWNPIPLNMDGVHLDGHCHHGRIRDLRGTCYDDLVALNAQDGCCAVENGPISDIDVDGLYADYCHSAVRILSAPAPVSRVTIRNVHGNFYCYTVGLTHYFPKQPRGRFDDIVVEDVFAAKAEVPPECGGAGYRNPMEIIHTQGPVDVGNLTVSRIHRVEKTLPTATIGIDSQSSVEHLTVRDCRMDNRLDRPVKFFYNRGRVGECVFENNVFRGQWENTGAAAGDYVGNRQN